MKNSVLCYLEETAKRFPEKVAVFDEYNEITFLDLKKRALDLAYAIIQKYGKRRMPVLVYLPKSIDSIVSFLGILYSGNFYTPTDIEFPEKKVENLIDALHPQVILVNTETAEKISGFDISSDILILNIDDISPCGRYDDSFTLVSQIMDVDPVYTLFTSGSTGKPKGVIITNHNVIDYIDWGASVFPIDESTIMGNQIPFYFDVSGQDIYMMLKTGASMGIIPPRYFAFPVKVLNFINEKKINFLNWVPSAFINIAAFKLLEKVSLPNVTAIEFGGEVMPVKHMNYWKKYLPNLKFMVNMYGPTETSIYSTYYVVDREFKDTEVLPLGKACENTGLLLLDDADQLITPGQTNVLGELCIYGSSLSVGYWDAPEKTAERFVRNPLNKNYEEKIYKTGDLVYYNDLGEMVFAGRKDFQIKHLGYRIELGEIEAAAMGIEGIQNVCVSYDEDKKQIILFYISENIDLNETAIGKALSESIPKYMMPSVVLKLDAFPLNDNGKIDRKNLFNAFKQGTLS